MGVWPLDGCVAKSTGLRQGGGGAFLDSLYMSSVQVSVLMWRHAFLHQGQEMTEGCPSWSACTPVRVDAMLLIKFGRFVAPRRPDCWGTLVKIWMMAGVCMCVLCVHTNVFAHTLVCLCVNVCCRQEVGNSLFIHICCSCLMNSIRKELNIELLGFHTKAIIL